MNRYRVSYWSTRSPHFSLRGKVGQLSKREESALMVYLYCISVCPPPQPSNHRRRIKYRRKGKGSCCCLGGRICSIPAARARAERIELIAPGWFDEKDNLSYSSKSSWWKTVSAARNWINFFLCLFICLYFSFMPAVDRGYLVLSHHWQDQMGDLTLTEQLRGVERLAADNGLTLVLTLNPFVSTDSANFQEGVKQGLFVMERNSSSQTRTIPALTWFKVNLFKWFAN